MIKNTESDNNNDDDKKGGDIAESKCKLGSSVILFFIFSFIVLFLCKNQEIGEICGDSLWNTTLVVLCLHIAAAILFGIGKYTKDMVEESLTFFSIFLVYGSLTGEMIILYMQFTNKDCMILVTDGSIFSIYHLLLIVDCFFRVLRHILMFNCLQSPNS